jgi:hypothetical protein
MKKASVVGWAVLGVLDLVALLYLAGSVPAFAAFVGFSVLIVLPAVALARTFLSDITGAVVAVVLLAVPWYFARKAIGMPLVFDLFTAAVPLFSAFRSGSLRRLIAEAHPSPLLAVLPMIFALTWLGWRVVDGDTVRFYGLFAIDFGNLTSVVASLRASPMLPLSYVSGPGPLSYHWFYFTLPALLADFAGARIPAANALVLTNLLMAAALVHALVTVSSSRIAAVVLFAPFTTYFFQVASARLHLGPFGMPGRNHLLLSPLNSMLVFGNNTFALVLALFAIAELERWNRDGRLSDLVLGSVALAAIIGYSVTLIFPLTATIVVWTLLGRVRRPLIALPVALAIGVAFVTLFVAIHVLISDPTRHVAVAFDGGAFLRVVVTGMLPLWGMLLLSKRGEFTIYHVLIAACIAVPSMLYVAGNVTGATDFSMKTASLLAVAIAPLLSVPSTPARRAIAAGLVLLGAIQSSSYLLQFPWYRLRHTTSHCVTLPRDYVASLEWIRDNTPRTSILADPSSVPVSAELFPLMLAERRVSLPTAYTRLALFIATVKPREEVEAGYLLSQSPLAPPHWRVVHNEGRWTTYARE